MLKRGSSAIAASKAPISGRFQLEQKARSCDALSLVPWSTPDGPIPLPNPGSSGSFHFFNFYRACVYGQIYGKNREAQRR
jgi:hypothetical protein